MMKRLWIFVAMVIVAAGFAQTSVLAEAKSKIGPLTFEGAQVKFSGLGWSSSDLNGDGSNGIFAGFGGGGTTAGWWTTFATTVTTDLSYNVGGGFGADLGLGALATALASDNEGGAGSGYGLTHAGLTYDHGFDFFAKGPNLNVFVGLNPQVQSGFKNVRGTPFLSYDNLGLTFVRDPTGASGDPQALSYVSNNEGGAYKNTPFTALPMASVGIGFDKTSFGDFALNAAAVKTNANGFGIDGSVNRLLLAYAGWQHKLFSNFGVGLDAAYEYVKFDHGTATSIPLRSTTVEAGGRLSYDKVPMVGGTVEIQGLLTSMVSGRVPGTIAATEYAGKSYTFGGGWFNSKPDTKSFYVKELTYLAYFNPGGTLQSTTSKQVAAPDNSSRIVNIMPKTLWSLIMQGAIATDTDNGGVSATQSHGFGLLTLGYQDLWLTGFGGHSRYSQALVTATNKGPVTVGGILGYTWNKVDIFASLEKVFAARNSAMSLDGKDGTAVEAGVSFNFL